MTSFVYKLKNGINSCIAFYCGPSSNVLLCILMQCLFVQDDTTTKENDDQALENGSEVIIYAFENVHKVVMWISLTWWLLCRE